MSINNLVSFFLLLTVSSQIATALRPSLNDAIKLQTNGDAATDLAIKELIKQTSLGAETAKKETKLGDGVSICLSNFNTAIDNLNKALQNIKESDKSSLGTNLSATMTEYVTCSDTMKETGEINNVVYKSARVFYKMVDNCMTLAGMAKS